MKNKNRAESLIKSMMPLAIVLSSCGIHPVENNDYDKFGLVSPAKYVSVDADDNCSRSSHYEAFFNRNGQVKRVKYLEADGSLILDEKYFYDSDNRLLKVWPIGADGQETGRFEYEYDGRFVSKYTAINMNNQEIKRWEYANDGEHITRVDFYEEGDLAYITVNNYCEDSYTQVLMSRDRDTLNVGQCKDLKPNKPCYIHSEGLNFDIEYNDDLLPVRSVGTVVDTNGALYWNDILDDEGYAVYEYEYDSRGNWIVRKVFFGDGRHPGEVVSRTIRY